MTTDRASFGRSIFTYSSAMLLSHFVRLIQGLLVVKLMEPVVMGLWLGIQLIATEDTESTEAGGEESGEGLLTTHY